MCRQGLAQVPGTPVLSPQRWGLFQNHSATHGLQGCLYLLCLGFGNISFDFLGQGLHQLLGLPETDSKVRRFVGPRLPHPRPCWKGPPQTIVSTRQSQGRGPRNRKHHLDEVYALDVVLDLFDQFHFVNRLCLCQADGEMRLFFLFREVFLLCHLREEESRQGKKGWGEGGALFAGPPPWEVQARTRTFSASSSSKVWVGGGLPWADAGTSRCISSLTH